MSTNPSPFGGGGGQQPWQFLVGAPSGGDDTGNINTALANAYNYAIANNYYAEVIFNSATYLLSGNTSTGSLGVTGKCKAQIPLPVVATTGQKLTIVLRGMRDASALYYFAQTTPQQSGATLKTTLNASAQFGSIGAEPSVIGGPLPVNGYGAATSLFSNCLIVIDGITIQTPNNPQICGFDLRGMAEANVINGAVLVNTGNALLTSITFPTNGQQFGLYMPQVNNNDNCNINVYSAEGQNYGLVASEHTVVWSARTIQCLGGIVCTGGNASGTAHGIFIQYASIEACQIGLQLNYDSASPVKLRAMMLDFESGSGAFANNFFIFDPSNFGVGEIGCMNITAGVPRTTTFVGGGVMSGGSGLRPRALDLPTGHIIPPAVPASGTPLTNGSGADAMVAITGGTVSAITIDGTATGFTATGATVVVPNNKQITLTYTVAPSWDWVLF